MSKRSPELLVEDILESAEKILNYTEGFSYNDVHPHNYFLLYPDYYSSHKKELTKALLQNRDEFTHCAEWYCPNDDSCFYRSDTIRLYNQQQYLYYPEGRCHFIVWNFSKRKKVSLTQLMLCHEPPVSNASANDFFTYKIRSKHTLQLKITNHQKQETFEIIGLGEMELGDDRQKCEVLTIVRRK